MQIFANHDVFLLNGLRTACLVHKSTPIIPSSINLATQVLNKLWQKHSDLLVSNFILGHVLPGSTGQAPARQALIKSEWQQFITTHTVNKVCGSGMYAIMEASNLCALSDHSCNILAGGMENMTEALALKFENSNHLFLDGLMDHTSSEKTLMTTLMDHYLLDHKWDRSVLDAYIISSIEKQIHASTCSWYKNHIINTELTPTLTVSKDQFKALIPDEVVNDEALNKPGILSKAHISTIASGAAIAIISNDKKNANTALATIRGHHTVSGNPHHFFKYPIQATLELCNTLEWPIESVDAFEVNEAFASVPIMFCNTLDVPLKKVNMTGGACIIGHPLGMSGARIIILLAHLLHANNLRRGIATICIGSGEATAIALENHLCQ